MKLYGLAEAFRRGQILVTQDRADSALEPREPAYAADEMPLRLSAA